MINNKLSNLLQANNLFKLVIAGVQLVGRAFGRAVRKEFAGRYICLFSYELFDWLKLLILIY